jgi:hypothetical protein
MLYGNWVKGFWSMVFGIKWTLGLVDVWTPQIPYISFLKLIKFIDN